jgi:hypothetical protein
MTTSNAGDRPQPHRSQPHGWAAFRAWVGERPFFGGLLIVLSGVELFFSGQLDLGNIQVQFGIEGLQATIIPVVMALLGVLIIASPKQRVFYGVVALVLSLYSIVGVNLGGFIIGTLLSVVGGISAVAWMPRDQRKGGRVRTPADDAIDSGANERMEWIATVMAYPVRVPVSAGAPSPAESVDAPEPPPFAEAPVVTGANSRAAASLEADRPRRRAAHSGGRAAVAVALVASGALALSGVTGTGAQAATPAPSGLICIPILMGDCSDDGGATPTPSPTPTSTTGDGLGGIIGGVLPGDGDDGGATDPGTSPTDPSADPEPIPTGEWGPAVPDNGTVFTLPAQRMTTRSLSFVGLNGLGLVKVPITGGKTATVIKLAVDQLTLKGYGLTIRRDADGPSALETDDTIVLTGHVVVYLDSLTAVGLTLATDTPPPASKDDVPDSLLGASFGLIGVEADHMDRIGVHLQVNQ